MGQDWAHSRQPQSAGRVADRKRPAQAAGDATPGIRRRRCRPQQAHRHQLRIGRQRGDPQSRARHPRRARRRPLRRLVDRVGRARRPPRRRRPRPGRAVTADTDDPEGPPSQPATRLVRVGRDLDPNWPFVNPPVTHASTVLFDSVAAMRAPQRYVYGRRGNPTTNALTAAIAELEGAAGAVICPSGLSAATVALLATASRGDRGLMVDTVYGPVRHLATTLLTRFGIDTVFFDPAIGAGIASLITPNTRVVYAEAPGSLTFEM